jgi:hypothetical protein
MSLWRLKIKHCDKFQTKMTKIVVKSGASTPENEYMEIENKTLCQLWNENDENCREKRDIHSYSNREASLTEGSVSSDAAQQHFR